MSREGNSRNGGGQRSGPGLEQQAEMAGWQTPTVNDAKGSDYAYSSGNHDTPLLKAVASTMAGVSSVFGPV